MHILYVTNFQGPSIVAARRIRRNRALGATRKVEVLARCLRNLGHQVHVVSMATPSEGTFRLYKTTECVAGECDGAVVTYLPAWDVPRLSLIFGSHALAYFLRRIPYAPDLVLLYNLEWYFVRPVFLFARSRQIPVVVEYEDNALEAIGGPMRRWHTIRGRRSLSVVRKAARGALCVTPELARQLDLTNSQVVPGVVGNDILMSPRGARSRAGRLRSIYTGGLTAPKGPDLAVLAAHRLQSDVELDIYGDGPTASSLEKLAQDGPGHIRLHGEVPRGRLVAALADADIAVNPHRMRPVDSGGLFPFKILEYLGAGLPILTTPLGTAVIEHPEALVQCPADVASLAAGFMHARKDLHSLTVHAQRARTWVGQEYSEVAVASKMERVLTQAVAGRRSATKRLAP